MAANISRLESDLEQASPDKLKFWQSLNGGPGGGQLTQADAAGTTSMTGATAINGEEFGSQPLVVRYVLAARGGDRRILGGQPLSEHAPGTLLMNASEELRSYVARLQARLRLARSRAARRSYAFWL